MLYQGKERPDKFSHKFAGAMRKTVGLSHKGSARGTEARTHMSRWCVRF